MKILGKVKRAENCPFNKNIPCNQCEYFKGYGINLNTIIIDIFCEPPSNKYFIIDENKLKLILE